MSDIIPDNNDRAEWARHAVTEFRNVCHGSMNEDGTPDIAEAAGDLIADVMHLCQQNGVDPFLIVRHGVSHYVAEAFDPNDPDGLSVEVDVDVVASTRPHGHRGPWRRFNPKPTVHRT